VIVFRGLGHELLQCAKALLRQHPVVLFVEQTGGSFLQRRRAVRASAEVHTALAVIAQIELGEGRLVAARERPFGAALSLQPAERELYVLAGAELARRVVGARAEIAAGARAADRHAVARLRRRIADPELGEERVAAQVLEREGLLAAELTTQLTLPVGRRQAGGRVGARELGLLGLGRGIQVWGAGLHRLGSVQQG
jgi:hypothetical protein